MRLFSKESSRERLRPAEQAVSRLTEQRHQAAQAQKVAKERLQAERQAAKEKQEAEQQAVKKKEAEYQTTKEKLQEAERQVTEWKAVAADYKESLEQYEIGYRQIFESLEQLKEQQEGILFLKEKQEYMLKNFSTLEGNIVDKLKGAQANSTQELLRRMEEIAHVQKRRNIWNKVLLVLSLLCSMTAVGGILVLLLYFSDRLAL